MTYEPLDRSTVRMISATLGPIQSMVVGLGNVNLHAGVGVVGPNEKCVWDMEGRRITFTALPKGGYIAGRSNERDEECYRADRFAKSEAHP
jgi:hypothetical protein